METVTKGLVILPINCRMKKWHASTFHNTFQPRYANARNRQFSFHCSMQQQQWDVGLYVNICSTATVSMCTSDSSGVCSWCGVSTEAVSDWGTTIISKSLDLNSVITKCAAHSQACGVLLSNLVSSQHPAVTRMIAWCHTAVLITAGKSDLTNSVILRCLDYLR